MFSADADDDVEMSWCAGTKAWHGTMPIKAKMTNDVSAMGVLFGIVGDGMCSGAGKG